MAAIEQGPPLNAGENDQLSNSDQQDISNKSSGLYRLSIMNKVVGISSGLVSLGAAIDNAHMTYTSTEFDGGDYLRNIVIATTGVVMASVSYLNSRNVDGQIEELESKNNNTAVTPSKTIFALRPEEV